jgi:2-methylcitrate dehydratase PrpD
MPEDERNSPVNAGILADVPAFVQGLTFADLPADVVAQALRCLLDLIGVAAAGSRTGAAQIVDNYAATQLRGSEMEARLSMGY